MLAFSLTILKIIASCVVVNLSRIRYVRRFLFISSLTLGSDGIPLTINCANYVYFYALQQCHALQHPTATNTFITELLQLHRGQGYDIHWREQVICPTEEEYKQMALDKTAGLFRLAVGLMQAFSTAHQSTNFTPLVNALGLYFQIRDDYINICRSVASQVYIA